LTCTDTIKGACIGIGAMVFMTMLKELGYLEYLRYKIGWFRETEEINQPAALATDATPGQLEAHWQANSSENTTPVALGSSDIHEGTNLNTISPTSAANVSVSEATPTPTQHEDDSASPAGEHNAQDTPAPASGVPPIATSGSGYTEAGVTRTSKVPDQV